MSWSQTIHRNKFRPTLLVIYFPNGKFKCRLTSSASVTLGLAPGASLGSLLEMQRLQDFPGGAVVKNTPANAGDRFEPWSSKIPHAAEQLSPCATTTEPAL